MGLSASQARLLSLTARQSNLEYEGQQINQQRTTLSNESSNYYNSLLEMSVPVPPSTNDYTKIVYTFTIGGNEATVKEALPVVDGGNTSYLISYTTTLSTIGIAENESYKTSASAKNTKGKIETASSYDPEKVTETSNYYLATMNRISNSEEADIIRGQGSTVYIQSDLSKVADSNAIVIGPDGYKIKYDAAKFDKYTDEEKKAVKVYIPEVREAGEGKTPTPASTTRYALSYAQIPNQTTFEKHYDTSSAKPVDHVYQITESDDEDAKRGLYSYKASNQSSFTVVDPQYADAFESADLNINDYYQYQASSGIRFVKREDVEGNLNNATRTIKTSAVATINVTKENTMSNATIEFDAQGRISTVTDEEGHTYTMTATTETDNAAYDDAYNQYEYNQYVYDQRQNEINANIKILQAQDKSLELRLSTLDTQHSAIQTELEAVKKVMSKNIDNSFKTFNA